jgi:uncharacterized phage protein (TIGR01671 family)
MREIEFRGRRKDTGEWAYRLLLYDTSGTVTVNSEIAVLVGFVYMGDGCVDCGAPILDSQARVRLETVGQYTGLADGNGVKIFEGDFVKSTSCNDEIGFGEVYFDYGEWLIGFFGGDEPGPLYHLQDCEKGPTLEVIGNIHDNPELLNTEDGTAPSD